MSNETFRSHLDRLVAESQVVIDAPKGTNDSRFRVRPSAVSDCLDRVRRSGFYESRYVSVSWDGVEVSRMLQPA